MNPPVHDLPARFLIPLLAVHQFDQREQAHHDLLRQREPGGVVQRHVAAVGDDAVDELDLARLKRQGAVAFIERLKIGSGSLAIILSKMLSS